MICFTCWSTLGGVCVPFIEIAAIWSACFLRRLIGVIGAAGARIHEVFMV